MPVSEATLSASPSKPQLQCGTGWPSAEQAVHRDVDVAELAGHAGRAADTWPASITPPPRPVPTMAETDERRAASAGPK